MSEKHVVRFEPVGIEIEVDEDQNILRAAAEQGIMLMHGCKEGQCASCKSFILDGDDIEHDRYSTFALPDYELEEGYTLLCRAHAYEDLTIELLNYDEDMIRSGLPIQQGVAEVVSKDAVTHDMRHLVLRLIEPDWIKFFPGQYMDITIPGTETVSSPSARATTTWCWWAAGRAWRPSCRCCGRWPSAAWTARPPSSTAHGRRRISASRLSCTRSRSSCRTSSTYLPCPSRAMTTAGTARPD